MEQDRGREAEAPWQIPARGWADILRRAWKGTGKRNLSLVFANTRQRFPSDVHPIVQSYVDVCLNGCLEIEAMYPPAKQANFAERFIRTTINWGPPWINDRIYPWRPFVYVPRAWAIDALIRKVLGQEMFAQITLK